MAGGGGAGSGTTVAAGVLATGGGVVAGTGTDGAAASAGAGRSVCAGSGATGSIGKGAGSGGSGAGAGAVAGAAGMAGARTISRSLAPSRRSCHGRLKPGRPKVCPLMAMLNSSACTISDSDSAVLILHGSRCMTRTVLNLQPFGAARPPDCSGPSELPAREEFSLPP